MTGVRRLELGTIRICRQCHRGRAELLTDDGEALLVRLDPNRARLLADLGDDAEPDVPWLGRLVSEQAVDAGLRVSDVVLDQGPYGLRGLVTWVDADDEMTVAACEPQEALETALRTRVPLLATDEAMHRPADESTGDHKTLH